tara:strand:+ start:1033 stop:1362 length:330 start_codon:yes stop_codon:yes gene_type:complete
MKKTFLIISLFFSFCSSQDMATDSQRNWCIAQFDQQEKLSDSFWLLDLEDRALVAEFQQDIVTAIEIYENDYPAKELDWSWDGLEDGFLSNDNDYLKYCKIVADINEID